MCSGSGMKSCYCCNAAACVEPVGPTRAWNSVHIGANPVPLSFFIYLFCSSPEARGYRHEGRVGCGGRAGRQVRSQNKFCEATKTGIVHEDGPFLTFVFKGEAGYSLVYHSGDGMLPVVPTPGSQVKARHFVLRQACIRLQGHSAFSWLCLVFPLAVLVFGVPSSSARRAAVGSGIALAAHMAFSERARRQARKIHVHGSLVSPGMIFARNKATPIF